MLFTRLVTDSTLASLLDLGPLSLNLRIHQSQPPPIGCHGPLWWVGSRELLGWGQQDFQAQTDQDLAMWREGFAWEQWHPSDVQGEKGPHFGAIQPIFPSSLPGPPQESLKKVFTTGHNQLTLLQGVNVAVQEDRESGAWGQWVSPGRGCVKGSARPGKDGVCGQCGRGTRHRDPCSCPISPWSLTTPSLLAGL